MFCLFAFTFVFQKKIPYAVYKYFYILSFAFKMTGSYHGIFLCFSSKNVTNLENKGSVREPFPFSLLKMFKRES